jgi:hypothetical protein
LSIVSHDEKYAILSKLSLVSLYMVLGINIIVGIAGYIFVYYQDVSPPDAMPLIRNIFYIMAFMELAVVFFLKRFLLSKIDIETINIRELNQKLFNISIIISSLCNTISIYGLVLVIIGDEMKIMFVFIAVSLLAYQVFRLRIRDLEKF